MDDLFCKISSKPTRSLDTLIWAAKLVLLSAGIISTATLFKVSVIPFTFNFIISTVPNLWISLRSWLSPPYIYIILNFIIITIAASSNFPGNQTCPKNNTPEAKPTNKENLKKENQFQVQNDEGEETEFSLGKRTLSEEIWEKMPEMQQQKVDDSLLTGSAHDPDPDPGPEPEPKPDPVEDEVDDGTLDATWKAIMEAQGKTVTWQLKKCDTWDVPPSPKLERATKPKPDDDDDDDDDAREAAAWAKKELKKSDTFNDTASLRREKSMSQDELNRRAEAFIKKFRLERLESEQRFIVNGGV